MINSIFFGFSQSQATELPIQDVPSNPPLAEGCCATGIRGNRGSVYHCPVEPRPYPLRPRSAQPPPRRQTLFDRRTTGNDGSRSRYGFRVVFGPRAHFSFLLLFSLWDCSDALRARLLCTYGNGWLVNTFGFDEPNEKPLFCLLFSVFHFRWPPRLKTKLAACPCGINMNPSTALNPVSRGACESSTVCLTDVHLSVKS